MFVIANSMVKCNKAATLEFNTRVKECKTAVQIIAKQHFDNWDDVKTLGELQKKLGTNLLKTLKISEAALKNKNPILIKRCQHVFEGKKYYYKYYDHINNVMLYYRSRQSVGISENLSKYQT